MNTDERTGYLQTSGPSEGFKVLFFYSLCVSEIPGVKQRKKNKEENNISNRINTTLLGLVALHSRLCVSSHRRVWPKAQSDFPVPVHIHAERDIKAGAAVLLSNSPPQFSVTKFYLFQISGSL